MNASWCMAGGVAITSSGTGADGSISLGVDALCGRRRDDGGGTAHRCGRDGPGKASGGSSPRW